MNDKLIPVEGHPDLARDRHSGAIININTTDIVLAKQRKQRRQAQSQEITDIKQQLSDIKQVLSALIARLEK